MGDETFDIFKEEKKSLFPTPRPFQDKAHEMLREGYRNGHRKQLICSGTGSGKTVCALRIIKEATDRGRSAMFICDRTSLINQTSEVASRYGMAHGIIQADHWRKNGELFQIASAQTLARRKWVPRDVTVVDECFVEGTLVETPSGPVPIQLVSPGLTVYNATGTGVVTSVTRRTTNRIVTVRLSNGQEIRSTESHRFFSDKGWIQAGLLDKGAVLYCKEKLRSMRERVWPSLLRDGGKAEAGSGGDIHSEGMLLNILREEIEEPNAQAGCARENGADVEGNGAPAFRARRERDWRNKGSASGAEVAGQRVGVGSNSENASEVGRWISAPLQDRHSEPITYGCCGVGREQSQHDRQGMEGQEERCSSEVIRVESVTLEEQQSGRDVFNIGVSNHPSYFAGGVLVHNCHTQLRAWTDLIKNDKSGLAVIGLSATPFSKGLGKLFTNVINAASIHELTRDGYLVPMRVFSCVKPDMRGAETLGGEWSAEVAGKRGMEIIGDVVTEWFKHGENGKTIVFGATIEHCNELCRQFNEAGVLAAVYTSKTDEATRIDLLQEFKDHDTPLRVLCTVEALAKGYDQSDVINVVDCRPLRKSLSSAIQMWGRGARISPETGKEFMRLMDFSGNYLRFLEDYEDFYYNGIASLDDGEKLDKEIRKDEQREERACPQCGHRPFVKRCVACGHESKSLSLIQHQPGEMVEITIGRDKKKAADSPEHLWAQLATYVRQSGKAETQRQRAFYLYRDIMGRSPPEHFSVGNAPVVDITPAVIGKIRSRQIAYSKGMQKGARRA